MDTNNDFMRLRSVVNDVVLQYMDLKKRIDWSDIGKSASILHLAKPFQEGYFTIAVAGKMSSGKSTFINSLIGENLLPTGHFQTTSCTTWIVSSDKRLMEVTYADGTKKTFNQNLSQELKPLVSVPEKFDKLPISHINILIKGNNDIATILKKKTGIEQMTSTSSNEELWKEYVASMPKSKIVDKVVIYLPLPKVYEGWRIVDTPGIGAVGGIQDATKKLLITKDGEDNAHIVDAVIMLHNGAENIQDESANKFVEDVSKSMGKLAEGRLFFVLTHAASPEFLYNRDGILSHTYNLFGERLNIAKERIAYIDSLAQRLLNDAIKSGRDFSNDKSLQTPLDGWTEKEWNYVVSGLLFPMFGKLSISCIERSNSTIFQELANMSRFEELRGMLYDFFNKEKGNTFNQLMILIKDELNLFERSLKNDIKSVTKGQEEIQKQEQIVEQERENLEKAMDKLIQKAAPATAKHIFDFVDSELMDLLNLPTISEVRTHYLQIIEKALETERQFFKRLMNDFSDFAGEFQNQTIIFRSLDLDDFERQANLKATKQVKDYDNAEKKLVKKGGFSSKYKDEETYPLKDEVDLNEKRRAFIALVIKEGRSHLQAYKKGVEAKVANFYDIVRDSIYSKTSNELHRLKSYENQIGQKEQVIAELTAKYHAVEDVQKYIDNFKTESNDR